MSRNSKFQFLIACYLLFNAFNAAKADFNAARVRGTIGDISHMYISRDGLELNVMNNDFLGGTDKYMTGSMSYGWLKTYAPDFLGWKFSHELLWNWRALTPAESETVGGKPLPQKVGRFADWMDLHSAGGLSIPNDLGFFKLEGSFSLSHIGNKGIKNLHRAIHHEIGMQTSDLEYTDQPEGLAAGYEILGGQIFKTDEWEWMVGAGMGLDKVIRESFVQINGRRVLSEDTEIGLELSVSKQLGSVIYDHLEPYRYELSLSLRTFGYYQPGIKWISSFVKTDPRGQLYAELLRFNVPL